MRNPKSEILRPKEGRNPKSEARLPAGIVFAAVRNSKFEITNFKFSIPLGLAFVLAGCSVGPNYHAPKTDAPAAFGNGAQTNLVTGPVASAWWREFNDELLNTLIQRAQSSNLDLVIATARVREARALRANAVADEWPVIEGVAGYNKSVTSKDAAPFPLTRPQRQLQLFNAGFDAAWELDIFGRGRRSIEASSAELAAAQAQRLDVLVTLTAEVARNYFELRGAQNGLAVARRNAENQRETLDLTTAKLKAGRATELDSSRAQAQLQATLAIIPPVESAIKRSIYRLSVLTGQSPTALEPSLSAPLPIPAAPPFVSIGDPASLLRRRPDIRAAERALAAATARIGIDTAELFPRVFFNGNLGFAANHLSGLGKSGTDTYSFGPQITWAALDLGHVRARIRAAHARAEAELATYEKTVLGALEESENALVDFGRERARRDYLRASVQAARQATELARQRYEGGVIDFLPVLDAERTQLDVEAQLAISETRAAADLVTVYKVLGGI